jgi:hypothetical protein
MDQLAVIRCMKPNGEMTESLFFFMPIEFHTPEITPWSGILLEKPLVAQLLKNFPTFYGTHKFITMFTRAHLWSLF